MNRSFEKAPFSKAFPADFNTLIRNFQDCPTKKSDNGYYIVADVWGTCFHRIATKKDRFEIVVRADKTLRTYTKIPASAVEHCFHVVVNFKNEAFKIASSDRYRVVGFHDPVKHVSKDYYTQSFIVYSKSPIDIEIIPDLPRGLYIENKNAEFIRPIEVLPFDCTFVRPF